LNENSEQLRALVVETRIFLARPGNSFDWSGWDNAKEALDEFDALVTAVLEGNDRAARTRLKLYFSPTGPIQEVSLSSGWGEEFVVLANKVDAIW